MKTVFLHIPKCGGISLRKWLADGFNADAVCPEQYDRLDEWEPEPLNTFSLYCGHFRYDTTLDHIRGDKTFITMLREPQSRLLSLYYFARSHSREYIESAAPNFRPMKELRLQPFLEQYGPQYGNEATIFLGSGDVWLALERLRQFNAVGVLEELTASLQWFSGVLGRPFAPLPLTNVTGGRTHEPAFDPSPPEREELTPAIIDLLRRHTHSDQLLYGEAKSLLYAFQARHVGALQAEIEALRQSHSWRVTAPFRYVVDQLRGPPN